jgi:hypothetical protein
MKVLRFPWWQSVASSLGLEFRSQITLPRFETHPFCQTLAERVGKEKIKSLADFIASRLVLG